MTPNATWTVARNARDANASKHDPCYLRFIQRVADRWADMLLLATGCL